MDETLIVVGASARAAAQSAVRAGFRAWTADLFADVDLAACAIATRVANYPRGLLRAFAEAPLGDWLYTGALENHPRLVDRLARGRRLLGCPGSVLRRVRDPRQLADGLQTEGLRFPDTCFNRFPPGEAGRWLCKPLRSAGGARVRFACAGDLRGGRRRGGTQRDRDATRSRRAAYFQRFVPGTPCSAVFVADGASSMLLGVTRQFVGCAWAGAGGFRYCGSIGPLQLSAPLQRKIEQTGNCLAEQFGLLGLFGVDFLVSDDELWTLEVNPRYTASVEVLERACDISALAAHVAVCRERCLSAAAEAGKVLAGRSMPPRRIVGKAILFAHRRLQVAADLTTRLRETCRGPALPAVADIPVPGTVIEPGQPVLTAFAEAATIEAAQAELRAAATAMQAQLGELGGG